MERRGFLKAILCGMAAVPAASIAAKMDPLMPKRPSTDILTKRWEHDGIQFTEYTVPTTVPPHFKKEGDTTARFILIPPCNIAKHNMTTESMVDSALKAYSDSPFKEWARPPMDGEVVSRFGKNTMGTVPAAHITILRIHGREGLMGVCVTQKRLIPVSDFYEHVV